MVPPESLAATLLAGLFCLALLAIVYAVFHDPYDYYDDYRPLADEEEAEDALAEQQEAEHEAEFGGVNG